MMKPNTLCLSSLLVATLFLRPPLGLSQEELPEAAIPALFPDPAVPMIQLPTDFRTRRENTQAPAKAGGSVDLFNAKGPGCVRHIWFLFLQDEKYEGAEIEIRVDGATEPQVRVPVRVFFGLMHDFEAYHIASPGMVVLPNFTVDNDPLIPKKASPGGNCYLPIPFTKSCRISLHSPKDQLGVSMVDWHQYPENVKLTPFRFYAQHHLEQPAKHRGVFPILEEEGRGFVAAISWDGNRKSTATWSFIPVVRGFLSTGRPIRTPSRAVMSKTTSASPGGSTNTSANGAAVR